MKEYYHRGIRILIKQGDITKEEVEAIVNPANSWMIMGGGVALAIKKEGGEEIEIEARKHAPVPIGKAIVTRGGKLKSKYVIHAPTMERPGIRTNIENVVKAARAAFRKMRELNIRTIAFPALGAGIGGVRVYDSIRAILEQLNEALNEGATFREVRLIAWKKEDYDEFLQAVKDFLGREERA